MDNFVTQDWLVLLATLVFTGGVLAFLHWFLLARHSELSAEKKLPRQLLMLLFTIIAVIMVVLALPVIESSRNQLLGLLGVLVSGVIAFSSTTIVSNLMSGVVLSLNKPFQTGDFIRCEGHEGRVTKKGLLDTEIQTRQRTLVHIANSFLISNPVDVILSSGTLISADVSIGYDVHHSIIEQHLQNAAVKAKLKDAFVHITELGNFAINYKVSGMLEDTKMMLTTQSALYAAILDELHVNGIEIMSPSIMTQRPSDPNNVFIPEYLAQSHAHNHTQEKKVNQEDLVFDKAEEAEMLENQRNELVEKIITLKAVLAKEKNNTGGELAPSNNKKAQTKEQIEHQIATLDSKLSALNSRGSK